MAVIAGPPLRHVTLGDSGSVESGILNQRDGVWPPVVPSVVLAESISGRQRTDTNLNRFLKTCDLVEVVPERIARRAGALRASARRGSAVDAIVIAIAEPGGRVLASDLKDLRTLATHAQAVEVFRA